MALIVKFLFIRVMIAESLFFNPLPMLFLLTIFLLLILHLWLLTGMYF